MSMGTGTLSALMPSCAINLSQVASIFISSGALHSRSIRTFNSCDPLVSSSLCGRNPFGFLGYQRRDGRSQKYQCAHLEYFTQGGRGRGNNFWRGITLGEIEKRQLQEVFWSSLSMEVSTVTSREKVGVVKKQFQLQNIPRHPRTRIGS